MNLINRYSVASTLLLVVYTSVAFAQKEKIIRIQSDQNAEKVVPMNVKYRYEKFQPGTVSFYNGKTSNGQLNYNILLGDIQFVDRTRDTLSLAEKQTIKQIKIGNDTFFYDEKHGYLEVVQEYPPVKLAVHQQFIPISQEKTGGFGQSTGTSAVRQYGTVSTDGAGIHKLEQKGDVLIAKKTTYLLIDKNQRVRGANKSGILRLFNKDKKAINTYLEEHKIDFNQAEDLQSLLEFCQQEAS